MLKAIVCESCGAPLQIFELAELVTCDHCGRSLKFQSESLQKPKEVQPSTEVERLLQEIESLEHRWAETRQRFLVAGANGKHIPTEASSTWAGRFLIFLGLIPVGVAVSIWKTDVTSAILVALLGFGFCFGLGISVANEGRAKAGAYKAASQKYEVERRTLLQQLEPLQSQSSLASGR